VKRGFGSDELAARCAKAGNEGNGSEIPEGATPIVYLPGVSRQELRAVQECPGSLKPLVELQYWGVCWTQKNGKDWTVEAFLVSEEGGLGLDVARDATTRRAMLGALAQLATTSVNQCPRGRSRCVKRRPYGSADFMAQAAPLFRTVQVITVRVDETGKQGATTEVMQLRFRSLEFHDFGPATDRDDLAVALGECLGAHGLVVHDEDRATGPDAVGAFLCGDGRRQNTAEKGRENQQVQSLNY
jgi:hypothetical protein